MKILWPYKMCVRFEDSYETIVNGNDEEDCMYRIGKLQESGNHGEVTWYSGCCDEDYVGGEYVGRENFIYE